LRTLIGLFLTLLCCTAQARDLGQWGDNDSTTRLWFQQLLQPDNLQSCCGEADGYYADEYSIEKDATGAQVLIAVITDDRPDGPLKRPNVPLGTRYIIPNKKIVDATKQRGNPTGHTIVFLGYWGWNPNESDETDMIKRRPVLCFVLGSGT
jgi:hypothetical protein